MDRGGENLGAVPDAVLASRAGLGDAESMSEIVHRYWSGVVSYSARFAPSHDAAQDVAQDAFLALWFGKVHWKQTGSLRAFLYGVARNLGRNGSRRWREVRVLSLVDAAAGQETRVRTPADELEESEIGRLVAAAVAALPTRRQEIFVLARVHGLSHEEIAETLSISPQTVANQMTAALGELRRRLASLF